MFSERKIVTAVATIVSLFAAACSPRSETRTTVRAGESKLAELRSLESEMASKDRILLKPLVVDAHEGDSGIKSNGRDFKWVNVSRVDRANAEVRLQKFVRLADEILLLAAKKKSVVLVDRAVIEAQRDSARSFLESLARQRALEAGANPNYEADPNRKDSVPYDHSVAI